MVKVKQTDEELKSKLKEQIQLLKNSTKLYDDGCIIEAYNMALRIRVLLHDTNGSSSLLKLLEKKDIIFYDTSKDEPPENPFPLTGLTYWGIISGNFEYVPRFKVPPRTPIKENKFDEWWNKIVLDDKKGNKLTRRELVLYVVDKDGGAHVDASLDETYANITRRHSLGEWSKEGKKFDTKIELHSIRQIAEEVLLSLKNANLDG